MQSADIADGVARNGMAVTRRGITAEDALETDGGPAPEFALASALRR